MTNHASNLSKHSTPDTSVCLISTVHSRQLSLPHSYCALQTAQPASSLLSSPDSSAYFIPTVHSRHLSLTHSSCPVQTAQPASFLPSTPDGSACLIPTVHSKQLRPASFLLSTPDGSVCLLHLQEPRTYLCLCLQVLLLHHLYRNSRICQRIS